MPKATPVEERFWAKVDKSDPDGCWLWTGQIARNGYGVIKVGRQPVGAHVVGYELQVGPVPPGHELDHVRERGCRFRHCVRDVHLEPVTHRENVLRGSSPSARNAVKTHCDHGHELAGANLYVDPNGWRYCRECQRIKDRARPPRKRRGRR